MSKFYQIKDIYPMLKHPEKYSGERPITMRSSWEISFVTKWLDINDNILEWKSEVPIKYICATDGKEHRYFIDFYLRARTKDGSIKEMLIEVKPSAEVEAPKIPTRKTASYYKKVKTYIKNQSKWKQAEALCESARQKGRDIVFLTITEKDCPFFLKK